MKEFIYRRAMYSLRILVFLMAQSRAAAVRS